MTLNPERGEVIEGLGTLFRLAPKEKWSSTPLFEEARIKANEAFRRTAGKFINAETPPLGVDASNFIVQEYPLTSKLAFVFSAVINSEPYVYPYVFDLPRSLTDQLHAEGFWSYGLPRRKG